MATLLEKITASALQPADVADIALSLIGIIDGGATFCHLDPSVICLDDDNRVRLEPANQPVDCMFAAPEVVLDGAEPDQSTMWFSLGCLLYYMLNGQTYYEANGLDPVELCCSTQGTSLVDPGIYSGLAAEAIVKLTAWEPAARVEGVGAMLQIIGGIPSKALVRFVCNGAVVAQEEVELTETLENYAEGRQLQGADGNTYRVLPGAALPFRPGTHSVDVPVQEGAAQSAPAAGEDWLFMEFTVPSHPGRPFSTKVLPLNGRRSLQHVPISLLHKTRYQFSRVTLAEDGRQLARKELFFLDVPADATHAKAGLLILYKPDPASFSLILCDENRQYISNPLNFKSK